MIPVTKSYEPNKSEYYKLIDEIFESGWYTNRGQFVNQLESEIVEKLQIKESQLVCMNNGTTPIQIALKLLANKGEVITTPFSYVATTSSVVWEDCTPVFVDIHPEYLTIDESKIEAAITEKTTCILATHVFGNPCNIEAIESIAKKHNLYIIYDAAHCFGVNYNGKSVFEYGDVSTCSFHATKLFHTGEGGAAFCKDKGLFHKVYYSHNFGHHGPTEFHGVGVNGKMSEFHAALGLVVIKDIDKIISSRKSAVEHYREKLDQAVISHLKLREGTDWNYSYLPIIFKSEEHLLKKIEGLNAQEIFPRRYFCPSLNNLPYLENKLEMEVSENIAQRILCLPLFVDMDKNDIDRISDIINANS